jgi:hypothetical protein
VVAGKSGAVVMFMTVENGEKGDKGLLNGWKTVRKTAETVGGLWKAARRICVMYVCSGI